MDTAQIFFTQVALNALVYALIALWYVAPRLARLPRARALAPLLFLHTFRSVGLLFLVPGVVGPRLPDAFAIPAAYGDLLAVVLALVALLTLRAGWRGAPALVWLFNLEGTVDLLYAIIQGVRVNIAGGYALGAAWFIPTFVVPALLVTHVLIFWLLLRPQRRAGANSDASITQIAEHASQAPEMSEAANIGQPT
jgi:hypothetical protein